MKSNKNFNINFFFLNMFQRLWDSQNTKSAKKKKLQIFSLSCLTLSSRLSEKTEYFYVVLRSESHAKKCVERYSELANKTPQQLCKVSIPCLDDHHFKEEELKSVEELSDVCSQIGIKCLFLARIGRPDILR